MAQSNEQFKKDILDILKKQGKGLEEFKKEVREKLEESKKGKIAEAKQVENKSDFTYICSITRSTKSPSSQEEIKKIARLVSKEISPILKRYKVVKLEAFTARIYE